MVEGGFYYKFGKYQMMEYQQALWLKIFYHNMTNLEGFFTEEEALDSEKEYKYSILGIIDQFKRPSIKYEFILEYPELQTYNRWKQTNNPLNEEESPDHDSKVEGFVEIYTSAKSVSWGGLCKTVKSDKENSPPSLLNGSPNIIGGELFTFAVGVYNGTVWMAGDLGNKYEAYTIPSNASPVNIEILWMRIYGYPFITCKSLLINYHSLIQYSQIFLVVSST